MKWKIKRVSDYGIRVFKGMVGILFFLLLFWSTDEVCKAEEFEDLHAISAVLMDAKSGRVLMEKNGKEMRPMASTTKIMTCILALEYGGMEEKVLVSKEAARQPAVHLQMQEGQEFYLKDLLYSLMLESHNDTAVAIAEHVGGSVEAFAEMMNEKAKSIGCEQTYFITPNGLDAQDEVGTHSISAEDLAKIMSYCILESSEADKFLEITRTNSYEFTDVGAVHTYSCQNHNAFLDMMEGAISGKTGYTGAAGYCYVGALERDGRTFVVALLGSGWPNHKNYKWEDTKRLMNYGVEKYQYQKVPIPDVLKGIRIEDGEKEELGLWEPVVAKVKVDCPKTELELLVREEEQIHAKISRKKEEKAPVESGERIGTIQYYIDEEQVQEYPIIISETIPRQTFQDVMSKIIKYFLGNDKKNQSNCLNIPLDFKDVYVSMENNKKS